MAKRAGITTVVALAIGATLASGAFAKSFCVAPATGCNDNSSTTIAGALGLAITATNATGQTSRARTITFKIVS